MQPTESCNFGEVTSRATEDATCGQPGRWGPPPPAPTAAGRRARPVSPELSIESLDEPYIGR